MASLESEWNWQVELEAIRRVLRAEARHDTLPKLAERLTVPVQALRTILRAGEPHLTQEEWQRLDAFRARHPAREPEAGAVAAAILVARLPATLRDRTRGSLVRLLHEAFEEGGAPLPGWLEEELMNASARGERGRRA